MPGQSASRRWLALVAFIAFSLWINWQAKRLEGGLRTQSGTALLGKEPPEFTLSAIDGRRVSLTDYLHKKNVALVFWASWCGPCRLELPALKQFYERARPMRDDFEILAISMDDYADAATGAANAMHLPFPVLVNGQKVAGVYGVEAIPQTLIVGKSGTVNFGQTGFNMGLELLLAQKFGLDPKPFLNGTNGATGH
jgi:peroxiredoxin